MYTEEYESKGFPFKDLVLKLVLVVIFVFLLVWLLPKFISPTINTKECNSKTCDVSGIDALTSQIFMDNLERMKEAAISYYTDERLPKEVGDSDTMTLSDMIGKKLLVALIDKNNKVCDLEKSYVKITKLDDEYVLKVNLKDSEKEDYILVHLGCYTYCDSYICEKQETNVPIKGAKPSASKPTPTVPIKGGNPSPSNPDDKPSGKPSDKPSDDPSPSDKPTDSPSPKPSDKPSDKPTDSPSPKPPKDPKYIYEYKKTTNASFSNWTAWSAWGKTNCGTQEINCNDQSTSCLKKLQMLKRKEKIGTYQKTYAKTRNVVKQTGSYTQKSCSKYNYVEINKTLYATTTTTTYTQTNTITSTTRHSTGGWTYNGRGSYSNPPRDSASTHYKFAGADYSYCSDTCTTLPNYYYDSYTYSGGLTSVSSTTTPGNISSSSSSSTTSTTTTTGQASCGEYVYKTIPIYGTITITEKATRTEPLYGTVCYQSTKTRKLISSGSTKTKWSEYGDKSLLSNGWYYTGRKKLKK